jgi:hypothetical protein
MNEINEYKPVRIAGPITDVWNGVCLNRIRRICPCTELSFGRPCSKDNVVKAGVM